MDIRIPYGDSALNLTTQSDSLEVLESRIDLLQSDEQEDDIVLQAMANPIESPRLCELAKGRATATIILSDHTRPVPSKHIVPFMLAELRKGNPDIDITLLIATGFHRNTTLQELEGKLGKEIIENEKIIVHDCQDDSLNVEIGVLPSGARLVIDRRAAETELLIAEGFIEPHFFAGFSGGRKSVLPGVCSKTTVLGNHCAAFIDSPYARTGVLENNPIHRDMLAAARLAKLEYIVNVIINEDKRVVAAFAGDPASAHRKGCELLGGYCLVKPKKRGDIVVSSNGGAPLDQNIYQSVKGLTTAESAAAEGAVLIICARCDDGTGSEDLFCALRDCESPEALLAQIRAIPMDKTKPDQWQYQILARVMSKHHVIFVSEPKEQKTLEDMKIEYAPTVNEALARAFAIKGKDAHLVVIPNGISVMVEE